MYAYCFHASTYPRGETEMLLQQPPHSCLRLHGLKIKVAMRLTTITHLEHKTRGFTPHLHTHRQTHLGDMGLQIILILEVLKADTTNVLSHCVFVTAPQPPKGGLISKLKWNSFLDSLILIGRRKISFQNSRTFERFKKEFYVSR